MTPDLKITSSLFSSLNVLNTYPQKVTLTLQQYKTFNYKINCYNINIWPEKKENNQKNT
jgi:hypothetical protein